MIGPLGPNPPGSYRAGPNAGLVSGEKAPFWGDIIPGRIPMGEGGRCIGGRGPPKPPGPLPGPNCEGEGERGEKAELLPGGKLPRSGELMAATLGKDATELKEACLDKSEPITGELAVSGLKGAGAVASSSCPCVEEGVTEIAGESAGVVRLGAAPPLLLEGKDKLVPPVLTLSPRLAANL